MSSTKKPSRKESVDDLLASLDDDSIVLGQNRKTCPTQRGTSQDVPTQIATATCDRPLFHMTPMTRRPYHNGHNYYPRHHMSMSSAFICNQPTSQDHAFAELEAMLVTQNQAQRMLPPNYNPTLTGRMIPTPNDKKPEGKSGKKKLVTNVITSTTTRSKNCLISLKKSNQYLLQSGNVYARSITKKTDGRSVNTTT